MTDDSTPRGFFVKTRMPRGLIYLMRRFEVAAQKPIFVRHELAGLNARANRIDQVHHKVFIMN